MVSVLAYPSDVRGDAGKYATRLEGKDYKEMREELEGIDLLENFGERLLKNLSGGFLELF